MEVLCGDWWWIVFCFVVFRRRDCCLGLFVYWRWFNWSLFEVIRVGWRVFYWGSYCFYGWFWCVYYLCLFSVKCWFLWMRCWGMLFFFEILLVWWLRVVCLECFCWVRVLVFWYVIDRVLLLNFYLMLRI